MNNVVKIKKITLLAGDILMLALSLPLMLIMAFGNNFNIALLSEHIPPFAIIYIFLLTVFYMSGLYDTRAFRSATSLFPNLIISSGLGIIFGVILFYITEGSSITPKTNLLINMLVASVLIWFWRVLFQRFLAAHFKIKIAIAGINEHSSILTNIMLKRPYLGYYPAAFISTDPLFAENKNSEMKVFPADNDLVNNLKNAEIDTVVTAENPHLNPAIAKAFYECIPHKIRFLDLARSYEILTGRVPISYINQSWFIDNINEQQKKIYDGVKRLADIIAGLIALISLMPLWPIIALAIKWNSSGAVFYSQERVGQNGKFFNLIKFRSMIENAESGRAIWAQEDDPRVTSVGKFIRRTHLDELPQMINIIKGDISLIGPRPERPEFIMKLEKEIPHYGIRHIIKPGFTGWAQVNFPYARTAMDTYEKFEYDLYYLKNRSLVLDTSILLKTFNLFFKNK